MIAPRSSHNNRERFAKNPDLHRLFGRSVITTGIANTISNTSYLNRT
ncbi:uncharacterized protein METZ01_LOCUS13422 [marine metagenome]|uniref:Uncharacterized protein n=1 Tax=marine metagenome TaxID=408172 RepID=A0A381P2X6_9ZZZZ